MSEGPCYHDAGSGSGDGDDEGSGRGKKTSKCGSCKFGAECDEDSEDMICMCNIVCNGHNDNPVCGSDGVTYDTPCHVREVSCLKQLKIDIKHVGRCHGNSITANTPSSITFTFIIIIYSQQEREEEIWRRGVELRGGR
ncbi:tomoregulin-1-like [Haplochromis burtoni]|uniref:tomoregulin-1-like n=1 Tax=Haplochromis burtoni TaxID=8153 RepID=UPI001C2CFE78|nr:tomoregulin-1-like [Haplochromis burtoni]